MSLGVLNCGPWSAGKGMESWGSGISSATGDVRVSGAIAVAVARSGDGDGVVAAEGVAVAAEEGARAVVGGDIEEGAVPVLWAEDGKTQATNR
jgi:hypothetical protein